MDRLTYWFGSREGFLEFLITILCVFLCLTVHEFSHGFAAYLRGDKTAYNMGRLSLNPLAHIDPIGFLCLILFGFGWAKPVMVNPTQFKRKTMKLDMVLTALAGPLSNFIMAFLAILGTMLIGRYANGFLLVGGSVQYYPSEVNKYMLLMLDILKNFAYMNLGLGIFNLIPIPPLDGSKVLSAVLPTRIYFKLMQYERFGFIALIILINLPIFNNLLTLALNGVLNGYIRIIAAILG